MAVREKKLTTIEKVILLKSVDIFDQATVEQLGRIAGLTEEVYYQPGQPIFEEGQPGDALYFLLSGNVVLENKGSPAGEIKANEPFGVLPALDLQPRLFTAKAAGPVRALKLNAQDFHDLLSLDIELVQAVLRALCRRIREGRLTMG
jgi:CRP-like cAMP-binding protein